jgi:hypothetical protein
MEECGAAATWRNLTRRTRGAFSGRSRFICGAIAVLTVWISFRAGQTATFPGAEEPASPDPFCTIDPEGLKYMAPSTRKMAALLDKLRREQKAESSQFLNREMAALYRRDLTEATNSLQRVWLKARLGVSLLNAGETHDALTEFNSVLKLAADEPGVFDNRSLAEVSKFRAVSYLRLGEQENCLTNHTSQSCILPIRGDGVHKWQAGSRKAIEILQERLKSGPDLSAVWLLNLAYMTVGEYPEKVPQSWRIPSQVFESDYNIKRFPDVAGNLGLDINDFAGGAIGEDFDADGDLDILMSDWSLEGPMHYFINNGDGTFSDGTALAGLAGVVGGLNIVQGDYNNDKLPDVLVFRGGWLFSEGLHPDSLLRNDGNNHFTDVTEEAGLLAFHPNQTGVWLDFNGDGWLDIYFGYESSAGNVHPCKLFRNNRNGTFTECAAAAGVANVGFVKGVTSADYNNDGRPDLYLSRRGEPNILYRNDGPRDSTGGKEGDWKFTDVSVAAGVTEPIASFPTWFFDYNNDGWEDIFVSGYAIRDIGDVAADYLGVATDAEKARLYRNNRDGTFTDVTKEAKLHRVLHTMGSNFGDFDNDGWLDMYLGTGDPNLSNLMPNRAFRNNGGTSFQDVTTAGGFGHIQKGHGVSFADFDQDGDQDIYHSVGGAYQGDFYRNVLFENPGHGNHWITLRLEGIESNAAALGARIKVVTEENGAERSIYRTVTTGGSFGANPLRQQIGLGRAKAISRIEIFWPTTGKTQVFKNITFDRFYALREGEEKLRDLSLHSFSFSKQKATHKHASRPGP